MHSSLEVFAGIDFDPYTHTYRLDGEEYTSVTTYISQFKPPFDGRSISEKKGKELGVIPRMLQDEWSVKSSFSSACGSDFHLYVETFLRYNRRRDVLTPIHDRIAEFHRFWHEYEQRYEVIEPELIVFDTEWKLAGTVDLLLRNKETNRYALFDWKTNETISRTNKFANMLEPLQAFPNSNYYHYAVQLTLYKHIIQRNTSLQIDETQLIHFPYLQPFEVIPITDVEPNIEKLMQ